MKFFITKICACVSDSGKDEYKNKDKSHKGMYKFRLLDDDEEIYFYGWSKTNDDDDAFLPLDCYGAVFFCPYTIHHHTRHKAHRSPLQPF